MWGDNALRKGMHLTLVFLQAGLDVQTSAICIAKPISWQQCF